MWPAFALFTLIDAALIHLLPLAGDGATGLLPAFLLAGFFNLVAIAVLAPLAALVVRRVRPDLPRVVAVDFTGTALIALVTLGLLGGGLLHRPVRDQREQQLALQADAARSFVATQAPSEFHVHLAELTTLRLQDRFFRSCVPGDSSDRAFCVFVDTAATPPFVREDPSRIPNGGFRAP